MDKSLKSRANVWMSSASCSLEAFRAAVEMTTDAASYPLADDIQRNIPIYDSGRIRSAIGDNHRMLEYMTEWNDIFADGPGVVVFQRTYPDGALIDAVTEVLSAIISDERQRKGNRGDHFGKAGENARVWNAHEKLCLAAPKLYARYNANDILALISRSWLGPLYQITAQVNLVYPGGKAQSPHRDYHMGFQTDEQLQQYPLIAHQLSAALTLQGAIAHCDMPIESGPTKLLPYSQRYLPGYFAPHRLEFREYFEAHYVQLPLKKGDTLFFNPALFHAAGSNTSKDIQRFANLLQVGSGYGRSIEIVDRGRMSITAYPVLRAMAKASKLSPREVENVIAATAEGYPFPADLDIDSPLSGMAPPSQQDIMREALKGDWEPKQFTEAIEAYVGRRSSNRNFC
jgi:ectoine hydroxylase-related dioxygenase (phytanoyl-CoA dioxygenase family)